MVKYLSDHGSWNMKLVQTSVADDEYRLLRDRAVRERKSMKQVTREALRAHLLPDRVNPEDPIFHIFPLVRKKGPRTNAAEDHDEILYRSP